MCQWKQRCRKIPIFHLTSLTVAKNCNLESSWLAHQKKKRFEPFNCRIWNIWLKLLLSIEATNSTLEQIVGLYFGNILKIAFKRYSFITKWHPLYTHTHTHPLPTGYSLKWCVFSSCSVFALRKCHRKRILTYFIIGYIKVQGTM